MILNAGPAKMVGDYSVYLAESACLAIKDKHPEMQHEMQYMADQLNLKRLAIKIESKMWQANKIDGRTIFYPEQFIGFSTIDDCLEKIMLAFKLLDNQQRINLCVEIICQYKHKNWSGHPAELGTETVLHLLEFCPQCNSNLTPIYTCLRAELPQYVVDELSK